VRTQCQVSQAKLADLTGIQPATLSRYESGRKPVSLSSISRIADALQVTTDTLMNINTKLELPPRPAAPKVWKRDRRQEARFLATWRKFTPAQRRALVPIIETLYRVFVGASAFVGVAAGIMN
jgi:transcriptional regulator with XRE-family HTH domain